MSRHTPGPWTMHPIFSYGAEVRSLTQVAWCGEAARYGESGDQIIDAAEACANARLIAAAPELLAACEALLAGSSKAAPLARMAIAKAKGETT